MKQLYCILLISILLTGCRGEEPVRVPDEAKPIGLSAGVQSEDNTKALINNVNGLAGDGFVVWGTWEQDPIDDLDYTGDYAFGSTNRVFGLKGTKAYYPDWDYAPQRFWTRGTYAFAAALPASAFSSDHAMHNDNTVSGGITGQIGTDGTLTLGTWDLRAKQIDLMVAFDNVDNTSNTKTDSDKVNLLFQHQLAQISFKANFAADNLSAVEIKSITLYGNSYTATQATFAFDDNDTEATDDDQITASWTLGAKATSKTDHFAQTTGSWNVSGSTIMEEVLVFPETFNFTIVVDYVEAYGGASATVSQSGSVSGTWEAGKKYVYEFTLSSKNIVFSEPVVTPWAASAPADDIPAM